MAESPSVPPDLPVFNKDKRRIRSIISVNQAANAWKYGYDRGAAAISSSPDTSDSVGRERESRRSSPPLSGGGFAGPPEKIRRTVAETRSAVMTQACGAHVFSHDRVMTDFLYFRRKRTCLPREPAGR